MRRSLWPDCTDECLGTEKSDILAACEDPMVFVVVRSTGPLGGFVQASIRLAHLPLGPKLRPGGRMTNVVCRPDNHEPPAC